MINLQLLSTDRLRPLLLALFTFLTLFANAQYCTPTIMTSPGVGISNVDFNTINNTSAVSEGYVDYSAISTTLTLGNSYNLTVTPGSGGQIAAVFIDWNQDLLFSGSEIYYMFTMGVPLSISVPLTAVLGNTTMRILTRNGFPPINFPCDASPHEAEDYNLYIDNSGMNYVSSTSAQSFFCNETFPSAVNKVILAIEVVTVNPLAPINSNSFTLNTTGTSAASDIAAAKIWYTGNSDEFATSNLFGTEVSPSGTFTIAGTQVLNVDTNYFWVTYDITAGASPGNLLDVEFDSLVVDAISYVPTVTSPLGNQIITTVPPPVPAAPSSVDYSGTEFWFCYSFTNGGDADLRITGDVATTGTVSIPGLGYSEDFCFNDSSSIEFALPYSVLLAPNIIQDKGIHITTDNEVLVSLHVGSTYSSDEYLVVPVNALETDYFINLITPDGPQGIFITAAQNGTTVTVNNTGALGPGVITHPANSSFNITLNEGQTYYITDFDAEVLNGSRITSDKPIAVYSAVTSYFPVGIPFADGMIESAIPLSKLGSHFYVAPTHELVDYFINIYSPTKGNTISIDGVLTTTLCEGETYGTILNGPHYIESSSAAYVTNTTLGEGVSGSNTDPSSVNVQPETFFQTKFNDFGYTSYISDPTLHGDSLALVVETGSIAATIVGSTFLSPADFQPIPTTFHSYATIAAPSGYFEIHSPQPMMAYKSVNPTIGQGQSLRNMYFLSNPINGIVYDTANCLIVSLPIELLYFKGETSEHYNTLLWETVSEINNDFFQIEKSNDAVNWEIVAVLDGAGNSTESISYSTRDDNPLRGITYYRLKQVDFDGESSYSDIISLENKYNELDIINVHPNPSDEGFSFTFSSSYSGDEEICLTLYNSTGRVVESKCYEVRSGINSHYFKISDLSGGLYNAVFTSGGSQTVKKISISHH